MQDSAATKDRVYYDDQCPICTAEMRKLQRLQRGRLELVPISTLPPNPVRPDNSALLAELHFETSDGRWLKGVDANVAAWQHTPYGWLWRPLRWPVLRQCAEFGYRLWLAWRSRRSC